MGFCKHGRQSSFEQTRAGRKKLLPARFYELLARAGSRAFEGYSRVEQNFTSA